MLTQVCVYPEECLACLVRHAHILTHYNTTILITISRKVDFMADITILCKKIKEERECTKN